MFLDQSPAGGSHDPYHTNHSPNHLKRIARFWVDGLEDSALQDEHERNIIGGDDGNHGCRDIFEHPDYECIKYSHGEAVDEQQSIAEGTCEQDRFLQEQRGQQRATQADGALPECKSVETDILNKDSVDAEITHIGSSSQ